jgi:ABC-type amino acid transport substrate-binding protein
VRVILPILAALGLLAVCAAEGAAADPPDGRLKTIHDTATLRIAYRDDSRPFSFNGPQGQPVGYMIDLCERVAASLEHELGLPKLAIQWVLVDTQTRFEAIVDGRADMECGSTTISLSRMKIVDFSSIVFAESTGVLIKSDSGVRRFEELSGKKIGVITGSTNAQAIREQIVRRKVDATLVEFLDRSDGVGALARGDIDGFASDKLVLLSIAQEKNARDLVLLLEDLSVEPFGIMLPRGEWALRLAVNTALARVFRNGDVIDIYNKWFSAIAQRPSLWVGAVFTFGGLPE